MANYFIAFGGGNQPSGNILSTTFNTALNVMYSLTFDYAALGAGSENLYLEVAGETFTVTPNANPNMDSNWATKTFNFAGIGGSTTLKVYSGGIDNVDAIFDNVLVASIPEPEVWAMLLLGFLGIGWQMRRRQELQPVTA
ncbi:hypothetical protein GCM10023325_20210 [Sphingomonas lutea]